MKRPCEALIPYDPDNNTALSNYFYALKSDVASNESDVASNESDDDRIDDEAAFKEAENYPLQEESVRVANEILSNPQQMESVANQLVSRKISETCKSQESFFDQKILSKLTVKCAEAIQRPESQDELVDCLKKQVSRYTQKLMTSKSLPKDIPTLIQKLSSSPQISIEDLKELRIYSLDHRYQPNFSGPRISLGKLELNRISEILEILPKPLAPKEMLELFQKNLLLLNSKMEELKKTRTDLVPSIDKKQSIPFNSTFNPNIALPFDIITKIFSLNLTGQGQFINKYIDNLLKTNRIDYIKRINKEDADLGEIASSLSDLMRFFTGTEDLKLAMHRFKAAASQIEHLSLSKVTNISRELDGVSEESIKNAFIKGLKNLKSLTLEDPSCKNLFTERDLGLLLSQNKTIEKLVYHGFQGEIRTFLKDFGTENSNLFLTFWQMNPLTAFSFSARLDWNKDAVKALRDILDRLSRRDLVEELHIQVMSIEGDLDYLDIIKKFNNLRKLYMDFEFLRIKNKDLLCDKLKELKKCQITELGIKNLNCYKSANFMASIREALPKLEKITLENIPYFEHHMGELVKLASLEEITLSDGKMAGTGDWFSKKHLQQLVGSKSLKTLRLETFSKIEESEIHAIRYALSGVDVINSVKPKPEEEEKTSWE